ncbi:MAG: hypothetical protein J2P28_18365 [Actinobacteria bacterium]|nr:hypothetical protein [Actinomycetota bacterium]
MPSPALGPQSRGDEAPPARALLADYSLDMTGKDLGEPESARAVIPPGTGSTSASPTVSLADPAATAAPDRFIRALASGYDARVHGEMKLHFNPFGGFTATAEWVSQFRNR